MLHILTIVLLALTILAASSPRSRSAWDDDDFVNGLLTSGIPLAQLDSAFAGKSCSRLNKLLAVFWKVPQVARELALLFGGKEINDNKQVQAHQAHL
jgi:hypothetical protein